MDYLMQSHPCRRTGEVQFNLAHKKVHIFLKGIGSKVNIKAWLEFELIDYNIVVQYPGHYTTITPPNYISEPHLILGVKRNHKKSGLT